MPGSMPWRARKRWRWESPSRNSCDAPSGIAFLRGTTRPGCDTRDSSSPETRDRARPSTKSFMARRTDGARRAYVDTSAFIAFLDRSDSHHPLFRRLFSDPPRLLTSALVIAEGHGWFLRRYDRRRAIQFLSFIEDLSAVTVRPFDSEALKGTSSMIRRFEDQSLTLADGHGLLIMKEDRVSSCWSTDRHLGLTGVKLAV